MCEFTIASAIGLIALFNLPGYPDCSVGHPHYGYNDDKQEIVCWGYQQHNGIASHASNPRMKAYDYVNGFSSGIVKQFSILDHPLK